MKHTFLFLLLILLLGLTACSKPADRTLMNYEQSLSHADSLVQCGAVDSARAVRLISGLHREYNQIKELSDGRHVRLKPVSGYERFFWGVFSVIMFSISGAMLFSLIRFKKERSHRNYLVTLSENEQRLRNNEREREELEECLKEMSLTDEEREEVHSSLTNLMDHGSRLDKENESLRARLKEYEEPCAPRTGTVEERGRACPDARRAGAGACFRHDRRRRSGEAVAHPAQIPCGQPVGLLAEAY